MLFGPPNHPMTPPVPPMPVNVEALARTYTTERVELAIRRVIGMEEMAIYPSICFALRLIADELARDKKHGMGG
jgi:hypothetical protein